jgi:CubicO group peptidase (beta-lactamase class C family)
MKGRPSYGSGSGQPPADGGAEQGFTRIRRERKQASMRIVMLVLLSVTTATAALASDSTAQKVDQLFRAFANAGSPGCSVGVIRNGNFIYKKSFGYASLELGVPLTPESVFYVGSISKQFTAASVVLAAEQGYLSLDDDVRKYLPELPDYGHPVTLRQMLHQTSGFRDLFDLIELSGGNPAEIGSPGDIFKLIVRQKGLNSVPGAEWNYSNSNYFLLAEAVQRATRKSLAQFAAEHIFQPLGMKHTLFFDDNTLVVPNRVAATSNHRVMKPSNKNRRLPWSVRNTSRTQSLSRSEIGLDANRHIHLLSERTEGKSFLDILSHRAHRATSIACPNPHDKQHDGLTTSPGILKVDLCYGNNTGTSLIQYFQSLKRTG